jgi:large subunit ribosomal protein L10
MVRPDKASTVAELTDAFRDSTAAVLTEYRGLTVAQLKELRRAIAGNATYAVVKNTLSKIAARDAGVAGFDSLLVGPSAIAFVSGDPVEVAKGLRDFSREHPMLVIKGGVLDGKSLSADEVRRLADLESREVLLAKLAGGLLAPAQQLATVLNASAAQLARVLGAVQAKAEADPSLLAGGDGASATEPAAQHNEQAAAAPVEAPEQPPAPAPTSDDATPDDATPDELPTDGTPGVEATPSDPAAEAAGDDGGVAQAVADAVDVPPTTDVADDATSAS